MNIHGFMLRNIRFVLMFCGMSCIFLVVGCSDNNDNSFKFDEVEEPEEIEEMPIKLAGCADTDSCFSNPTLEIGESRVAQVHIPSDYTTSTRYPLIILLHGFAANGAVQSAYLGLGERVDSQQYILVVPDGTENEFGERFWNATPACCAFYEGDADVDDVAYIRSLIEEAAATYSIDVDRIGLFGHSNGGFMALRMACEASDLVTSVVSLAGSTFENAQQCAPAEYPVSVLTMHGDLDETILYEGGLNGDNAYPGAIETIDRFADHAGCDASNPTMQANIDVLENIEGEETTVRAYTDCADGVEVELWTLVGGPHIPFPWVANALDSMVGWILDHSRG